MRTPAHDPAQQDSSRDNEASSSNAAMHAPCSPCIDLSPQLGTHTPFVHLSYGDSNWLDALRANQESAGRFFNVSLAFGPEHLDKAFVQTHAHILKAVRG